MFRDTLHKIKIFFCDDDIEKIYVRDSTVIRNNEIHKMYDEILNELGDLATVVSRNVCLSISFNPSLVVVDAFLFSISFITAVVS